MKRILVIIACSWISLALSHAEEPPGSAEKYWPQWRGPLATGVAPRGDPPIEWSESNNVRWKVKIPGKGHASPIVWGDRVYIQTAIEIDKPAPAAQQSDPEPPEPEGRRGRRHWGGRAAPTNLYQFRVMAFDRRDGKVVWQRTVCEAQPHEGGHQFSTQASNSPVTDGEHFIAYFGSRGLHCFDMQGKLLWQKDLGDMRTRNSFGEGSSPTLYGNAVVVNWDHEGDSFIVALDKRTGDEKWRVARDEGSSWSTPIVVDVGGKPQVITSAANYVRSYDLANGEVLWKCGGLTQNVIPSPMFRDGIVYTLSGFRGNALLAIRLADARGDITASDAIVWKHDKGTPYVPSGLLYDDTLYFLSGNKAILSCFDAKTGKEHYSRERLEGIREVYASPVGARDRVYIAGREGTTVVLARGPELRVLATNKLDDGFDASPAIVDDELYLRGYEHLYCIAKD